MTKKVFSITEIEKAANLVFKEEDNDSGTQSTRDYLKTLLSLVWEKGESFSGKRPFGNSGWERDLFSQFYIAGLIDGSHTDYDDGYVEYEYDSEQAYTLVFNVIDYIFDKK